MSFTDEDLKQLKDASSIEGLFINATIPEKIKALLARLEAAKHWREVALRHGSMNFEMKLADNKWRKAAGK